jgi:hypothetical protein
MPFELRQRFGHPTFQASDSRCFLNVGFPSKPTRFCDVLLRCSPSTKCKHNYDDNNNNNEFIVVIILIIVIIDFSVTILQRTSYISEV